MTRWSGKKRLVILIHQVSNGELDNLTKERKRETPRFLSYTSVRSLKFNKQSLLSLWGRKGSKLLARKERDSSRD